MFINLRNLRKSKGWTQGQLALMLGISLSFVKKLEAGKKNPSMNTVGKIAELFGCEKIDEILQTTAS